VNHPPRLPHDADTERSVLAEIAAPLHRVAGINAIGPEHFYDPRHIRIATALRGDKKLSAADHRYLDCCIARAWPLTAMTLLRLCDLAERRRRALELACELTQLTE
jgi:hypothetical protein